VYFGNKFEHEFLNLMLHGVFDKAPNILLYSPLYRLIGMLYGPKNQSGLMLIGNVWYVIGIRR
jgi:hypothetical protein